VINSVTTTFARQRRAGLITMSARVFQALRIVVNEEDNALREVLEGVAPWALARGGGHPATPWGDSDGEEDGILAVLSYHSMEDKMAKRVIIRLRQEMKRRFIRSSAKRSETFVHIRALFTTTHKIKNRTVFLQLRVSLFAHKIRSITSQNH